MEKCLSNMDISKPWKNLLILEEGQEVELVQEPTNRYDPYAIKILVKVKY